MESKPSSALGLAQRLLVYFALIAGATAVLYLVWPAAAEFLPLGGIDIDVPGDGGGLKQLRPITSEPLVDRLEAVYFLAASLAGTVLLMLPITWVYIAIKRAAGFQRNFVFALMILPIVATTVVLLIQDSLPLAFGMAALVAAVRFRVQLRDALDGIFIFASVGVGLASGVGYLGVGFVMAIFFCYAVLVLWGLGYGANPVEQAKLAKKQAKLAKKAAEKAPSATGGASSGEPS